MSSCFLTIGWSSESSLVIIQNLNASLFTASSLQNRVKRSRCFEEGWYLVENPFYKMPPEDCFCSSIITCFLAILQKNVGNRERHWKTNEGIIQCFVGGRKRELRTIENTEHISKSILSIINTTSQINTIHLPGCSSLIVRILDNQRL